MTSEQDPNEYVNQNKETLSRIIKHSSDTFTRSLALAALVEYGEDATIDDVIEDLKQVRKSRREDR